MSSSRRGSEESILSMLERDSGRSRRWSGGRMTLYGAAVLIVAGLVGTLGWLARDNPGGQQVEPPLVLKPTPMVAMADASAVPAEIHGDVEGAAILDSAEPPPLGTKTTTVTDPPPLVLVAPPEAKPAPTASETAPEPAPTRPAAAPPARPAKAAAARAETPRARAAVKTTPAAKAPARRRQAVKKGKEGERDRVDTDVALISAIISHSGKRPPEGGAEKPESSQ